MIHSNNNIAFLGLLFLLSTCFSQTNAQFDGRNVSENSDIFRFGTATYNELHKAAVDEQVRRQDKPIKSLHTRNTKSLNGVYDFCLDETNRGFADKWFESSLQNRCNHTNFYRMPVPSAFNDVASDRRVRDYVGWFWYQTVVEVSEDASSHWFVQFENVNYLAFVWAQGVLDSQAAVLLGSHVGGHLPFKFNITQLTMEECSTKHGLMTFRLTIAVSNILTNETIPSGEVKDFSEETGEFHFKILEPDFDFFFYAGIMGDVNLVALKPVHITDVYPEWVDSFQRGLKFTVCTSAAGFNLPFFARIKFSNTNDGFIYGRLTPGFGQLNTSCHKWTYRLSPVETTDRWLPANGDSRHLADYLTLKLILGESGGARDVYELKISMRSRLDLKSITASNQLQGFGMHMEQSHSGRYMTQASILKDVYLLKQMGANVIRTSHYPYSSEFLDACDEHGIMVIGECAAVALNTFSEDKLKLHKQLLLEMVDRDRDHPSIVLWSVANEPQSQLPDARGYFESLLEFARSQLRTHLPFTAAIAQAHDGDTIGDLLDVVMVNRYYGWYEETGRYQSIKKKLLESLSGWANRLPGKPLIVSEFGADTLGGLHSWTESVYSEEYQLRLMREHEELFDELARNRSHPADEKPINFVGSLVWNFADFSTQQSLMRIGGRNRKGLFTFDREPKAAALFMKQVYRSRLLAQSPGVVADPGPCYEFCPRRMR